jgi:hypothetical protein
VLLVNSERPEGAAFRERYRRHGLRLEDFKVVQGVVVHAEDKVRMPHAWIEIGDIALDVTNSLDSPEYLGPKDRYYQLGGIRPNECVRYDAAEATQLLNTQGHFGPWSPLPDDVTHVPVR